MKASAKVCLLPLLFCLASVCAQATENAGTKNGNFLKLGTDARGVALGDSVVSMAQGADALRWNPAGLAAVENKELSGTHVQYYQGVQMENVSAAYPLEDSGIGLSAFYLNAGKLDGRDDTGNPTGDFTYYDLVGTLGYARKVYAREDGMSISLGAAAKFVQEKIDDQSFHNPAFDLGAMADPFDDMKIGLSVRNLSSGKANFAHEIIGGASYTFYKVFTAAAAATAANDAPVRYSVSGEYRMPEYYNTAVRAGYTTHDKLDNSTDSGISALRGAGVAGLTMGAGFDFPIPTMPTVKMGLDYAMAPFGALGISHTITVKVKW